MLERLGEVLRKATDRIANAIFLDKNLVDSIIKDLQRALIEADVNIVLVKELSDKIRKCALDERIKGIKKKEHIIKLLHDELAAILGEYKQLKLKKGKKEQNRIMFLGLYGAGKTTTTAKLGNYFSKRGHKVALIGLDTHRPAAPEQLQQLAEKHKLSYFIDTEEKNPVKIWRKYEKDLKEYNVVLIDTAGRHTFDKSLINEIKALNKEIKATIETPPEYGKYHWDGHRLCNFSCSPEKTKELKAICPVCKKSLIIGVDYRVEEIAKYPKGFKPENSKSFHKLLPLHEIIALTKDIGMQGKESWRIYNSLIKEFENEFNILLKVPKEKLIKSFDEKFADLVLKNREGKIKVKPGFDGEYGVALFEEKQKTLI